MRLHQVLTGAANVTEESVAVGHGNVSGYPFTVRLHLLPCLAMR